MKNMKVLIQGTSHQCTTFVLKVENGMVVELCRDTLTRENPREWDAYMNNIFEEISGYYRSDLRDLLDWAEYYLRRNKGSLGLQNISIYES